MPDQQTLYTQFRTGEVSIYDTEGIPPQLYQQAKKIANVEVLLTANPNVEFVLLQLREAAVPDKMVRQALYRAMDRQSLIDAIYYGLPTKTLSYLSDSHWAYNHDLGILVTIQRRRRKCWMTPGWRVGLDGVREKSGVQTCFHDVHHSRRQGA